jgi:hypothetical protein
MNALDGSNKHQQFIEILTKKIHMIDCFGCDDENDRSVGNPKRKV